MNNDQRSMIKPFLLTYVISSKVLYAVYSS